MTFSHYFYWQKMHLIYVRVFQQFLSLFLSLSLSLSPSLSPSLSLSLSLSLSPPLSLSLSLITIYDLLLCVSVWKHGTHYLGSYLCLSFYVGPTYWNLTKVIIARFELHLARSVKLYII